MRCHRTGDRDSIVTNDNSRKPASASSRVPLCSHASWDLQPSGRDYVPALDIYSFPSLGVVHRTKTRAANRVHHSLSRLEFYALLHSDFRQDVLDIREQYPAATQGEVDDVAASLGVPTPKYNDGVGLTTDLLLTVNSGSGLTYEAVYCKYSDSLRVRRANELLALEREIWHRRGVRFREFTEATLTRGEIINLLWLHPFRLVTCAELVSPTLRSELADALWLQLIQHPELRVSRVCSGVDNAWSLAPGTALAIVRWAIAQHLWKANMSVGFNPGTRVGDFLC